MEKIFVILENFEALERLDSRIRGNDNKNAGMTIETGITEKMRELTEKMRK